MKNDPMMIDVSTGTPRVVQPVRVDLTDRPDHDVNALLSRGQNRMLPKPRTDKEKP